MFDTYKDVFCNKFIYLPLMKSNEIVLKQCAKETVTSSNMKCSLMRQKLDEKGSWDKYFCFNAIFIKLLIAFHS